MVLRRRIGICQLSQQPMEDRVFSPDGKHMWTGSKWIPAPPMSEANEKQQGEPQPVPGVFQAPTTQMFTNIANQHTQGRIHPAASQIDSSVTTQAYVQHNQIHQHPWGTPIQHTQLVHHVTPSTKQDGVRNPIQALSSVMSNWSGEGVATRSEYWWFMSIYLPVTLILTIWMEIEAIRFETDPYAPFVGTTITILFFLITFIPVLSLSIRRIQDTGHSGWWVIASVIPIIGSLLMFAFSVLPSKPSKYGR